MPCVVWNARHSGEKAWKDAKSAFCFEEKIVANTYVGRKRAFTKKDNIEDSSIKAIKEGKNSHGLLLNALDVRSRERKKA